MIEKTKVVAAMLALDEFTPEQLGRFAGVNVGTARTVLKRHERLIEEVGKVTTGRRGGQPIRYRLTADGRATAKKQLEEAFEALGTHSPKPLRLFLAQLGLGNREIAAAPAEPPLGIAVADDTLERLLPAATSEEERLDLLKLAEKEARSALQDLDDSPQAVQIREMVDGKLADIQKRRAAIHQQNDLALLKRATTGTGWRSLRISNLRNIFSHVRNMPKPRPGPLHVQLWADSLATAAELRTQVAKTLEKRGDILIDEVPVDSEHVVNVGDAVFLLVDSRNTNALPSFQRAFATCRNYDRPLYVLDRDYNPGFRNLVFGTGAADYVPDIASLDQSGIENVISRIPRLGAAPAPVRSRTDVQQFAAPSPVEVTLAIRATDTD